MNRLRVALDLTCTFDRTASGIAYYSRYMGRALVLDNPEIDFRLVATRPHGTASGNAALTRLFQRKTIIPRAGLIRYLLWNTLEWPPVEWFTGEVDIVHDFFHQVPVARRALRAVTLHDVSFFVRPETHTPRTRKLQTQLLRRCARNADAYFTLSESSRNDMAQWLDIPPEKVTITYCGIEPSEYSAPLDPVAATKLMARLGIRGPFFVYVGTLEPRKNLCRLMQAHALVRSRRKDLPQLVLVGKKGWLYEPIFQDLARFRGNDDILYAGYLPREDMVTLMRSSAAMVYPSLYEGFGMPVLEAMASRTPVMTSRVSSLPEVAGDTAIYVEPEDVDSIAEGLETIAGDTTGNRRRVEKAYARAQTFTWERSARIVRDAYLRLSGRSSPAE